MFDDRVAAVVEQTPLRKLTLFDVNNFDVDAIMALGHRFDAIDHRCAVVVAVGESDGAHGYFVLSEDQRLSPKSSAQ